MLCHEPHFVEAGYAVEGALRAGQRYEARVQESLSAQYPDTYVRSPWFIFSGEGGMRYCQADGLLFDFPSAQITIVEIKLHHCIEAWWQLVHLYQPVVAATFGMSWKLALAEVCKAHDPLVSLPVVSQLHADLTKCRPEEYSIHIRGV
jgi:hypothetical protein